MARARISDPTQHAGHTKIMNTATRAAIQAFVRWGDITALRGPGFYQCDKRTDLARGRIPNISVQFECPPTAWRAQGLFKSVEYL